MSIDTINDLEPRVQYVAAAAQTEFDYTFPVFAETDVRVLVDGALQTITTDYTVSGEGDDNGGTITFLSAMAGDEVVTLYRETTIERLTDIAQNGPWRSSSYNDEQDKTYIILQELRSADTRALRLPADTEVDTDDLELSASDFASKYLAFDASGKPTPAVLSDETMTRATIGALLNPRTGAEIDAGVVPIAFQYEPGNLFRYGAIGNGSTSDQVAVTAAFACAGQDVIVPLGYTFAIEGAVPIPYGNRKVYGGGCFKKKGTTIQPLFLPADGISGLWFDDVEFDGLKASFSAGNAVPAILGHILPNLSVTNCYFHDIIDSAIKLRDSAGLLALGNRFYNCGETGIELQNYVNDPRISAPYVGTRPSIEGNHRIIGNFFKKIDDGLHGTGNGVGVLAASINTSYPIINLVVDANSFEDTLFAFHTENNVVGGEARNVVVTNNTIRGNVAGAGTTETSDGIDLVGVIGGVVQGNTIYNAGNITPPPGGDTSGITISGTSSDIDVSGNTVIDDTGNAIRTDYGILISNGTRIHVHHNTVRGCSTANVYADPAGCVNCRVYANPGAELQGSWGQTLSFNFIRQNIPATTTNVQLYPAGVTDWDELPVPAAGKLVGMSVLLSAAISAGTVTFKAYSNGVHRTNLNITEADFGGGVQATKMIATEDGVTIPALNSRLRVYCDTNGAWLPTTNDALVTLLFDTSGNVE